LFQKIVAALFVGLMVTTLFTTYHSARAAEELGEGVLRLHILANSDSESDQALKLQVRDAVLGYAKREFTAVENKAQAMALAERELEQLEQVAEQVLREKGCDMPVTASVEHTFFPTKVYDNGTRLPAGFYDALRLEIGQAKGKNWWCILYPALCFGGSIEQSEQALGEQGELATSDAPQIQVKFKLAEWWNSIIAFFEAG